MKRLSVVLLMLLFVFALAACSQPAPAPAPEPAATEPAAPAAPVAEEVKGVTVPAFSITVNAITVTNETMAAYPLYSVQATSVNSSGTESTVTFVGFAMKDVLAAAGLTENYIWLEASAADGYAVTLTGEDVLADTTLLAVNRDGSPFANGPWMAPCANQTTGNYLKETAAILVNTTEGKPDIQAPATEAQAEPALGELPEILDRTDKVEFAAYAFLVNGVEVNNDTLAGLSIYKITAVTQNAKGEIVESGYTGYKLADVLEACGIADYGVVKAIANDGYESELSAEMAASDYTLVAIEKDKELGEDGTVWLAPCAESTAKAYCKLVVEITAE